MSGGPVIIIDPDNLKKVKSSYSLQDTVDYLLAAANELEHGEGEIEAIPSE